MMPSTRRYAIPDVDLAGQHGGTVNPSHFAGHELVVLFCPADPIAAAKEMTSYNAVAEALAYNDAYMVAVCGADAGPPASRTLMTSDSERAWEAFGKCLDRSKRFNAEQGGVLLFSRGDCLQSVWHGTGHASEVIQALGERM
jgi:hypothetical protein